MVLDFYLKNMFANSTSYCSVTKSYPICYSMHCSMPGSSVFHYLLEFAQAHVNWVGNIIQPFHPLLSPSPPALNLSQHQYLFQWVGSLQQEAKILELQGWIPLGLTGLIWQSKGLSRIFSNTTIQKHQFFSVQTSFRSNSHIHTWLLEKPQLWLYGPLSAKYVYIAHFLHPFICQWTIRLLPCLGYCK